MAARFSLQQTLVSLEQRGAMRSLATQLLSAAVVLLFAAVILFGLNVVVLRQQIDNDRQADHTIEQLYRVERHLLGTELTVRGYALSRDSRFVAFYQDERRQLAEAEKPLSAMIHQEADHQVALERVLKAVRTRIAILDRLMLLAASDPEAVGRAILNPEIRGTMRAARSETKAMRVFEREHREALAATAKHQTDRNSYVAGGVLLFSVIFGALGLYLIFFRAPSTASTRPDPG